MCDNNKLGPGDKIVKFIPLCTAMNARFILQSTAAISWRKHDSLIRTLQLQTVHHRQAYTVWTQGVHGAWVPVLDTRSRQVELYQDIETTSGYPASRAACRFLKLALWQFKSWLWSSASEVTVTIRANRLESWNLQDIDLFEESATTDRM